jgi:hypothetical protein
MQQKRPPTAPKNRKGRPAPSVEIPFFRTLELTIFGVFELFRRFFRTLFDLARHPLRLGDESTDESGQSRYVKPYTFLAMTTFLVIKVIRISIVYLLIAISAFTFTCETRHDTMQKVEYPSLAGQFRLPSLSEVLLIGIPMVAFVLIFAYLYQALVTKRSANLNDKFVLISCYSIGFQYFLYLIALGIIAIAWFKFPEGGRTGASNPILLALLAIIIVFWPAWILYRLTSYQFSAHLHRFSTPWLSKSMMAFGAVLFCLLTIVASFAISLPLARLDVKSKTERKPVLLAAPLKEPLVKANGIEISLLVTNNTPKRLIFVADRVEYVLQNYRELSGSITSWKPPFGPVLSLEPGESSWLTARLTPTENQITIPSEGIGQVVLFTITPEGTVSPLVATIREKPADTAQ